jgi:uncharacterized protein (DUF362 family)
MAGQPRVTRGTIATKTNGEAETNAHAPVDVKVLKAVAERMRALQEARVVLNADMADQRKRLRDMGIEPKAYALALRIADLDDAAAKNNYMRSFSDSFSALSDGGQIDWLDVPVEAAGPAPVEVQQNVAAEVPGDDVVL